MSNITNRLVFQYLNDDRGINVALRSILLFGRNTATYKFALCEAILKSSGKSELKYEELYPGFVAALARHVKEHPIQESGAKPGALVLACKQYNEGVINTSRLMDIAAQVVPRYVFDAFHNVGNGTLEGTYRLFEHQKSDKKIVICDPLLEIINDGDAREVLLSENEARWNIVEVAWQSGLPPSLVTYNETTGQFDRDAGSSGRRGLAPAREVLLPYQKGLCFYCDRVLSRIDGKDNDHFPDVDHFIPRSIIEGLNSGILRRINADNVWNLVIACRKCNRGEGGKFDRIPDKKYFAKLTERNEQFAEEHKHTMRIAVMNSLEIESASDIKSKLEILWKSFEGWQKWKPSD